MMPVIDPYVLDQILPDLLEHGMEKHPMEACGLICPDGTIVYLTNESGNEQEYLVSSEQFKAAFYAEDGVQDMGFRPEDCIVWHTHPSGFVGPSRGDMESRRQPMLESLAHLVISLPDGPATYF